MEVYAAGAVRHFPAFAQHGDIDTGAVILTLDDGTIATLGQTRHNPRGYDIRMEVMGSADAVSWASTVGRRSGRWARRVRRRPRGLGLVPDRFEPAYREELSAFLGVARGDGPPVHRPRRPRGDARRLRGDPSRRERPIGAARRDPLTARIGLAIIGAGRMGSNHARLIAAGAPELRIVSIGDVDGTAAHRLAEAIGGATPFADPLAAISAPGVDAVLVAVSSVHHRAIVEAAAAAGKDILCEKPLALDLAETDAIVAAAERAGVRLQVGLMRRHDPDHVRARARIVAGDLGRPLLFNSRQYDVDPPPPAILDPRISGGIMLDMGIHEFDSARFLMGSEVVELQATGSVQVYPDAATHGDVDTAVVNLRFASGAIGSVELSRRVAFGEDVRTEVHGTEGSAFIGALPVVPGSAFAGQAGIRWDAASPDVPRFAAAYTDQARAFARSIQDDTPVSPSGADGRAAFVIAMAAQRALTDGGTVRVEAPEG